MGVKIRPLFIVVGVGVYLGSIFTPCTITTIIT